jgi:hypothetical protein
MKKRVYIAALLAAAVGAAVAWVAWPDADQRAYRQIKPGMTKEQIDALFPDGRFWTLSMTHERERWGEHKPPAAVSSDVWHLAEGHALVAFDKDGRAVGAILYASGPPPNLVERLRRWVGW